ncbi:guanylate kinase-associated protein mars [Agrilus planipennis]|uniref:Guanylate kinase-associated protein mars n=1 Tax=Agrilus planipennis TaxID=224129 RepID=A0A1W4XBD4_AGRPL|nr:guanylate kinase-associated protein mars [Agrilus planipennis]
MELSDYLRAGLKELQNKRTLVSHLDNIQQQMQRRRSSRLQNLMNLRKINEATLSPVITPAKVRTPIILKSLEGSPSFKRINSRHHQQEKSDVIKERKKEKNQHIDKRKALLLKWKEEKNKKLQLEKSHKKPIFKVSHAASLPSIDSANQFIKGKRITPKSKGNTPSLYKFAPKNHIFKPPDNIKPIYFKSSTTKGSNMPITKNTLLLQEDVKTAIKSKRKLDFKSDNNNKSKVYTSVVQPRIIETRTNLKCTENDKILSNNKDVSSKKCIRADNSTANYKVKNQLVKKSPRLNSSKRFTEIEVPSSQNVSKLSSTSKDNLATTTNELKTISKPRNNTSVKNLKIEKCSKPKTSKKTLSKSSHRKSIFSLSRNKSPEPCKKEVFQEDSKSSKATENEMCTSSGNSKNPKSPVTPVSSNSLPQTPKNNTPPVYISPFITLSRGKDNARKEYKQRLSKGGTCENSDFSRYTSPKAAAVYFTDLLNSEISEILNKCEKWEFHKKDDNLPDGACDMIDVAIGQSHLLVNQKLEQFRGLIRSAENKDGSVTCHDLHGFWDLVNIQIKNVRDRFANLERLQNNRWEEIICAKTKTPTKKKNSIRNKEGKRKADSKIRGFIEAARQKKKLQTNEQNIAEASDPKSSLQEFSNKVLPRRRSSTVSVSERGISSPGLTIMRASLSAKKLQQTLSSNSTPINLNKSATVVKSILKSGQIKTSKKRHKSVLFETAFEDNLIIHSGTCENNPNIDNIEPRPNVKKSISFSPEDYKVVRRSSRLNAKLPKSKLF